MKKRLKRLLPHLGIILGLVLLTLLIFDRFNGAMTFINNNLTKGMLCVFILITFALAGMAIYHDRKG